MGTRNADVNLIVRAKTEGEKAVAGLADTLEQLLGDAREGANDIVALGRAIGSLDKAAATVAGSLDKAGSALDRQRASIAENNAAYAALLRQQAEAQRVLDGFGEQANKSFVGPRTKAFTDQYEGVRDEVKRLGAEVERVFNRIGAQESQLAGSQSALLKLTSVSRSVAEGQSAAEAQIELTTQAMREQAAAAERVTEIQRRINATTGVDRPDASGSAARSADILAQADAEYRRVEAARAAADAQRQVNTQLAERASLESAIERNTGLGRVRATDAGATISALTEIVNKEHEAALASDQMEREADQLRAALDPLAAIQARLNQELERYAQLAAAGKIQAHELAEAQNQARARAQAATDDHNGVGEGGGSAKPTLFGLKPYELQNLSYQINDIVTGIASGQHVTQIIAQQAGQIFQIFPRAGSNILAALTNPGIAIAAATIGTIALSMKHAADEAGRLREITAANQFRADGGSYDPVALDGTVEKLQDLGAKAEDAKGAVKALLGESLNPALLDQFAAAAQNTAELLGTSLPDAAKQVAEAFSGGYDAVAALDDKLNFLTASEREHIRQLFEEGNAQAARAEAFAAYSRQAEDAANKQRGPWAEAARSLGKAWDAMMDWVADTLPVKIAIGVLNELASAVKGVGDSVTSVLGGSAKAGGDAGAAQRISQVQAQIRELQKTIAEYEDGVAKNPQLAGTFQRIIDRSKEQLAAAKTELARLERSAPDTINASENSAAAKQRADRMAELDLEQELQALRARGQTGLNAADSHRREVLAGEKAFREEIARTGDKIIAGRLREMAAAKETADTDKQNDAARKAALADRERQISQFLGRVVGAEGGAGKNPFSSASGYGQFTESTWKDQFAKVFPDRASQLSDQQILALRQNEQVARAILDNYARENARFLEKFGAKVTAGNLYLAHFLGGAGAKAVLQAPGDTPVDQVLRKLPNSDKVLSGNKGYLRTEGGKGRYRTAAELQTFISGRVGDTGVAQTQGQVEINKLLEQAKQRQEAFNLSVQHGLEDRQRVIDGMKAEVGLSGNALLAEQKKQAVARAELELRQKVEDANRNLKPGEAAVEITDDQVRKTRDLAAAQFDLAHAREALLARQDELQRPISDLETQRDILRQQAEYLRSIGDMDSAARVDQEISSISVELQEAYDALISFYNALDPADRVRLGIVVEAQLDNIIRKLNQAKDATKEWGRVAGLSAQSIAQAFASSALNAFNKFFERVARGRDVFASLLQSVREFAAGFISSVAQMILQLLAYAAAVSILRALGVPVPATSVGVHHTGGIAGAPGGARRSVVPALFASAMRYHTGGIVGLKPNEVPAILEQGEEVLTKGDPRHRANGGGSGGGAGGLDSLKVVNAFDAASVLEQAMASKSGEKVFINWVSRNSRAFKQALG